MKSYFSECFRKFTYIFIFFFIAFNYWTNSLNAEDSYLKEMQIDGSTKFDENSSELPTNPFQIVEMLRRANSMNDATNPSDALDDALESFKILEGKL